MENVAWTRYDRMFDGQIAGMGFLGRVEVFSKIKLDLTDIYVIQIHSKKVTEIIKKCPRKASFRFDKYHGRYYSVYGILGHMKLMNLTNYSKG